MSDTSMRFCVRGEGGHVHTVRATISGPRVEITCTCEAGTKPFLCRHRKRLLDGDKSVLLSANHDEMEALIEIVNGSSFGRWFAIERAYLGGVERMRMRVDEARARFAATAKRRGRKVTPLPPPGGRALLTYRPHES